MVIDPSERLSGFIKSPVIKSDLVLTELLMEASHLSDAAVDIFNFSERNILYIGQAIETLSGHKCCQFLEKGLPMFVEIACPSELEYLSMRQSAYLRHARLPDFDMRTIFFQDYEWTIIHRNGYPVPVFSSVLVLTYTLQNEAAYSVGFHLPRKDSTRTSCKSLLRKIKERHNEVYLHSYNHHPDTPYPINDVDEIIHHITAREREVLGMLANGMSTHEISMALLITDNTVETHRKNLLEKFQAKNAAELIKKASKVFWLE